jgi:dihydroorotase
VGLETELGLFLDLLVHKNKTIALPRLIEMLTVNPARLLQIDAGTLSPGRTADVTLIDPELEWTFEASASQSISRNTPFDGWKLKGRAVRTIVGGRTVWAL